MHPRIIYGKEIMAASVAGIPSSLVENTYTELRAVWRTVVQHVSTGYFSARATG